MAGMGGRWRAGVWNGTPEEPTHWEALVREGHEEVGRKDTQG
jgi:hypothetical protein